MNRRVVVTGLGVVSPLGCTVELAWKQLIGGHHGMQALPESGYDQLPCKVAATVKKGSDEGELDLTKYVSKSEIRNISMASLYSLVAGTDALQNAGWLPEGDDEKQKTGVCIGMGMVDLDTIVSTADALKKGYSRVSPFFVPKILPNMGAGHISIKYGFQGPNHTVSTACATGCHSIGDAFRFVQRGDADVMLCGGTEACISPLAIAGFCRLRALSVGFNDCPGEASRPFDKRRDGFVMGEGAGVLVLEELNHAIERNATIYAEILGYGLSGDATHITAPHEEGTGAKLAMLRALHDADVSSERVTYINAHATSTPLGDNIELKAIKQIFPNLSSLAVSSTKGAHGHLLGAAGSLESVFTVLACHKGILPPTINLEEPCEEGKEINCVPKVQQLWKCDHRIALKNSFGFGGTNACLCIAQYKP